MSKISNACAKYCTREKSQVYTHKVKLTKEKDFFTNYSFNCFFQFVGFVIYCCTTSTLHLELRFFISYCSLKDVWPHTLHTFFVGQTFSTIWLFPLPGFVGQPEKNWKWLTAPELHFGAINQLTKTNGGKKRKGIKVRIFKILSRKWIKV